MTPAPPYTESAQPIIAPPDPTRPRPSRALHILTCLLLCSNIAIIALLAICMDAITAVRMVLDGPIEVRGATSTPWPSPFVVKLDVEEDQAPLPVQVQEIPATRVGDRFEEDGEYGYLE